MNRPKNCEKCGVANFSYDNRPPFWDLITLHYIENIGWHCSKCIGMTDARPVFVAVQLKLEL